MFTSLIALLISAGSLFLYDLHNYRQTRAADLALEARLLGHVTTAALQFMDQDTATQQLAFLRSRPSIRAAAVFTPRGGVFARYVRDGLGADEVPPLPEGPAALSEDDRAKAFHRIVVDNEVVGTVFLSEDLAIRERVASYVAIAFLVLLAALVVSAALSAWLQKGITQPIIQVSSLARDVIDRQDYTVRATVTTRDEVGTLVDAFNKMLSEIERRTSELETSNAEVGRLNVDLEQRVELRTTQLQESNLQLRAANAAKSNFLSMMSHEIRTPMNGVLGMLELLALSDLDADQRATLEVVRSSGRSLLRIIDDILDFSKIEAGKLDIRPEVVAIPKVVANVVGIYSGNASSKGLVLRSRVDPQVSPAVSVDPLRLQQILNNLVSNAIKFTAQGFVEIKVELVERRDGEDLVRFTVTDSGIGISPQGQAMLFEPFSQAGRDISRVFGGTGLGLSIGKRLADLMGGSMTMSSEVGKGTSVSLVLPLRVADVGLLRQPDAVEGAGAPSARILGRPSAPSVEQAVRDDNLVLVVDDHPVNRLVLERQISLLGYASEAAEDGREALQMWRSGRYKLVLTDCNMPEMDGYELARAIRAEEAGKGARTLIIACTANALKGEAENCFAAGMDDYIAKPVELRTLLEKLDAWMPLAHAKAVSGTTAPPIEREVIDGIAGGDARLERQILEGFLEVNRKDVAALVQAVDGRDANAIVHAAHRMKGAARTIGALLFSDVCARLEAAARVEDWKSIADSRAEFDAEGRRLDTFLANSVALPGGASV